MESKATVPTTSKDMHLTSVHVSTAQPGVLRAFSRRLFLVGSDGGAAFHQSSGNSFLDDPTVLVDNLPLPGNDAATAACPWLFLDDLAPQPDRVADENRPSEFPMLDVKKRQGPHRWRI